MKSVDPAPLSAARTRRAAEATGPQPRCGGWFALYITRKSHVAAYLAEERRHDPHSVVKEQSLPSYSPPRAFLRAFVPHAANPEPSRNLVRTRRMHLVRTSVKVVRCFE